MADEGDKFVEDEGECRGKVNHTAVPSTPANPIWSCRPVVMDYIYRKSSTKPPPGKGGGSRVNVSKNQRKFRKSRPRSKSQFVSFFVYRNLNVCKKVKGVNFLKYSVYRK